MDVRGYPAKNCPQKVEELVQLIISKNVGVNRDVAFWSYAEKGIDNVFVYIVADTLFQS